MSVYMFYEPVPHALVHMYCNYSRQDSNVAILTATALYPQYNRNSEGWTTLHNRDKKEEMVDTNIRNAPPLGGWIESRPPENCHSG